MKIYHNPRCSKSRKTLALIKQKRRKSPEIIEYLKERISIEDLGFLFGDVKNKTNRTDKEK